MGDKVGRSTLFGIPLQQQWSYANSATFAPTYYLQTDAPLYYYSFTDAFIAMAYRSLSPDEQARLRPDDHRLQPGGHVRRGSHPPRAADVSRASSPASASSPSTRSSCRRRSRARSPASPIRRSTASSTSPAEVGPGRDPAQRHRHALRQGGRRAGVPDADEGALQAASRRPRSSGRTRAWAASCIRCRCQPERPSAPEPHRDRRGDAERSDAQPRELRHLVGRGGQVRRLLTGNRDRVAPMFNKYPDRFLFGTDTVAPANPAAYLRSSTCGNRSGGS